MSKGLAQERIRKRGDPVDDVPCLKYDKKAAKRNLSLDVTQMRQAQPSKFKQFE